MIQTSCMHLEVLLVIKVSILMSQELELVTRTVRILQDVIPKISQYGVGHLFKSGQHVMLERILPIAGADNP